MTTQDNQQAATQNAQSQQAIQNAQGTQNAQPQATQSTTEQLPAPVEQPSAPVEQPSAPVEQPVQQVEQSAPIVEQPAPEPVVEQPAPTWTAQDGTTFDNIDDMVIYSGITGQSYKQHLNGLDNVIDVLNERYVLHNAHFESS